MAGGMKLISMPPEKLTTGRKATGRKVSFVIGIEFYCSVDFSRKNKVYLLIQTVAKRLPTTP